MYLILERLSSITLAHDLKKQGRIHGNPAADDWAGAVMRKPFGIQKYDRPTDGPMDQPTDQHGKV